MTDFIEYYDIPTSLCKSLIEDFNYRKGIQREAGLSRGYSYIHSVEMNSALIDIYENEISNIVYKYIHKFNFAKETLYNFQMYTPYNVQLYAPGNYYSVWHCENNGNPQYRNRHLAFMTYLNTVTNGGGTEFVYQRREIQARQGLTLVWPAHFTHTHRGIPSMTEDKYIITGWLEFLDGEETNDAWMDGDDTNFYSTLGKNGKKIF
jgi:hypothetical protein